MYTRDATTGNWEPSWNMAGEASIGPGAPLPSVSVSVCLCLSDPSVEASAASCALTLTLCSSCALPPVLAGAAMPAAGTPDGLMRAAYLLSDSVNAPPDR